MGKYKKLAMNSVLFTVSNFGSKILLFIFVPFYTYVLGADEYGTVDTLTTTISLLLPLCSLTLYEAILRFAMQPDSDNKSIVTNSAFVFAVSSVASLITYFFFLFIDTFRDYWLLFYLALISENLNYFLRQYARGIGKVKLFAVNGVLNTAILVLCNLLLLFVFKMGVDGYLLSMILSFLFCNLILFFSLKIYKLLRIQFFDSKLLRSMLVYCIPLIPNAVMWWIMNASDRYVIAFFLGLSANGIYAVACKVPTVINTLQQIFMQAWQLSAIEESENSGDFYNNIYEGLNIILTFCASSILIIIKPLLNLVISSSYENVWRYVPWLLVASVYSGMASFLGTNYIVSMKTGGALRTSFIGAIVNIILNVIFTPLFGLNGPAFATACSFFVLWILRCHDAGKDASGIKQDVIYLAVSGFALLLQTIVTICDIQFSIVINGIIWVSLIIFTYLRKKELIVILIRKVSAIVKKH